MIHNKTECYANIHDYADYIQRYTGVHVISNTRYYTFLKNINRCIVIAYRQNRLSGGESEKYLAQGTLGFRRK